VILGTPISVKVGGYFGEGTAPDHLAGFRGGSFLAGTWSSALEDPNNRDRSTDIIRGVMTSVAAALETTTPLASSSTEYHVVGNFGELREPGKMYTVWGLEVAEAIRLGVLSSVANIVDIGQANTHMMLAVHDLEGAFVDAAPDDEEGEFLRGARDDLQRWMRVGRDDLARYVDLSKGTLRNMASGKHRPRPSTLRRFLTLHGLIQGLIRATDEASALIWFQTEGVAILQRDFEAFCAAAGQRLFPTRPYVPASRLVWREDEATLDDQRAPEAPLPQGDAV